MKNSILLLFACLLTICLHAQDNDDHEPHKITFIAGLNNSKYVGGEDAVPKTDYKTGFILGVNKDVKISPMLWANGGLLYYQNGADTDLGKYEFDYLMLPSGLKLNFGPLYAWEDCTELTECQPVSMVKKQIRRTSIHWILAHTLVLEPGS